MYLEIHRLLGNNIVEVVKESNGIISKDIGTQITQLFIGELHTSYFTVLLPCVTIGVEDAGPQEIMKECLYSRPLNQRTKFTMTTTIIT